MSVGTAHMAYFSALARSEIFKFKMHGVLKFAFTLSDKTSKSGKCKGKSHNQLASPDEYEDERNNLIGCKFFYLR